MTPRRMDGSKHTGFTLVELLVVIGIIALLVGILLPALSAARRQAGAVKCASQMREVGTCFQMYAMDNRGYFPPSKLSYSDSVYAPNGYSLLYGGSSVASNPVYWPNFIARYATKARVGTAIAGGNTIQQQLAKNTIIWGCPAFTAYSGTGPGGEAVFYTGYGMNPDPMYGQMTPPGTSPPGTFELTKFRSFEPGPLTSYGTPGTWYRQKDYTKPTERCLIADGRAYTVESRPAPTSGNLPDGVVSQHMDNMTTLWSAATGDNQTTIFIYRHGTYPKQDSADSFNPAGGKISFNVLYCDGHVATCTHGADAYKAIRMRFPG
jgi:prepilin-type N-terminal cleavage/methylation domain-containing protein/prepilin-type processing-associated H-X9-DG protein